jgi:hypothetical protein
MASRKSIGERHHRALSEVVQILERRDPKVGERVAKANHGPDRGIPSPTQTLETAAYHAECLRSLARIIDEGLPKKRGRGRPRKAS